MDQPMRWVCLCLDAHNFVAGPAPRADEISRMMHRGHVRPPSRDSPPAAYMLRSQIHQPIWVALCLFLNPPPTTADKALRQALDEGSTTMLAEIFLLRMEAIYRVSEGSAPTGNSRFVPITVPRSSPRLLWVPQQSRDFKDADRPLRPESSAS